MTTSTPTSIELRSTRSFLSVWIPSVVAIIGSGSCLFTASWWLGTSENGGAILGLVVGLSSIVSLTINAIASGSVDRGNRRRIVAFWTCSLIAATLVLSIVLGFNMPTSISAVLVGMCYCWISTSETVFLGACETTAADLAPSAWPQRRIALLTQIHSQVDRIIAPLFAGLLIGAGFSSVVPLAAGVLLLAVLLSVWLARQDYDRVTSALAMDSGQNENAIIVMVRGAREATLLVRNSAELSYMVFFGILGNLAVFPFYAVLPAYLSDYSASPLEAAAWFSWCAAAYGAGMLLGSITLLMTKGNAVREASGIGQATIALALISATLLGVTFAPSASYVVVAFGIVGCLFSVLTAVGGAIWLRETPPKIRARVFSLRRLTVYSSIPLGTLLMGFGGAIFGFGAFARWMEMFVLVALGTIWLIYARRHKGEKGSD